MISMNIYKQNLNRINDGFVMIAGDLNTHIGNIAIAIIPLDRKIKLDDSRCRQ